jgi:hypothetical protein
LVIAVLGKVVSAGAVDFAMWDFGAGVGVREAKAEDRGFSTLVEVGTVIFCFSTLDKGTTGVRCLSTLCKEDAGVPVSDFSTLDEEPGFSCGYSISALLKNSLLNLGFSFATASQYVD